MSPPSSWSISTRAAAFETRNEPLAITSCCRSQSAAGGLEQRLGQRQAGVVDDQVEAAERQHAASTIACTASSSVTSAATPTATSGPPISAAAACALARSRSAMTTQAPSAASRFGDRLADAAGGAGDQGDPGGERLRLRHPLELGLLQRPVLDAELLRLVDRRVRRDALGAAHHVDRVDVELAGHAGGLLVLAVAEHADARHQHDERVGAADGRRVGRRVAVVVALVVLAVRRRAAPSAGRSSPRPSAAAGRSSTSGLTLVRRKWSGQRRAERGEPRVLAAGQEVEHLGRVGEVADHRPVVRRRCPRIVGARAAAFARRSASGRAAYPSRAGPNGSGRLCSAMYAAAVSMIHSELASASSDVSPQAVMPWPPRMQPTACGLLLLDRGDVEAELEAGTAPRHPDHLVAEDLLGQLPRRRRRSRSRCRSRGAGGRRAPRRRGRAWRCRSTAPRRPCRAGSSRTRRPSRPRARRRGRRRRARASGPAAARRGRTPSGCRGRRRSPSPRAARRARR